MRFEGKSIIVTGAGSGIGRAAARLFASEGGRVICADLTDGADETAALIGEAATAIRMDAGNEADVIRTIDVAIDRHGGLDVMFANAGISGGMANIFDTDVALITEVLRVNLIGPFLAIKHAAPRIAEAGGGAIVLTQRGGSAIRRGIAGLFGVEGGCHQPGGGGGAATVGIERPR